MNTQTAEEIRRLFAGIRRAPGSESRYAPHKPLLLLMALARIQQGQPARFSFTEIEDELKTLLTEFGPSNAPKTRNMPFWFLQNDHGGKLWSLHLPASLAAYPKTKEPTLKELRQPGVNGGLSAEMASSLQAQPQLLVEVARQLLLSTFPERLHESIASAVGLDLTARVKHLGEVLAEYRVKRKPGRDKAFRDRVLQAYEYRCCVCGFDLRLRHMPAGLEAAHIQWHTHGGPDLEPNGLSLCALHHTLFDLGAFTLEPTTLKVLFSEHALSGSRGLSGELRHHGQELLMPVRQDARPGREFLEWNWKNVFKREGRRL
jgi:putative restriction endonuclease